MFPSPPRTRTEVGKQGPTLPFFGCVKILLTVCVSFALSYLTL